CGFFVVRAVRLFLQCSLLCSLSFLTSCLFPLFFFFNDTATTEIYTFPYTTLFRSRLGHEISSEQLDRRERVEQAVLDQMRIRSRDRKSTRLNSSHVSISYAVFCLKKKKRI